MLLASMASIITAAPAGADQAADHHVKYTVTSQIPVTADIYYRDTDPPTWADYSHNPYQFSPKISAEIGPNTPWVLDVTLTDPDRWAMVTATIGPSPHALMVHCELAVDGVLVASGDGPKGALCSIRHW